MTRSRRLFVAAASMTLALGVALPASTVASAAPGKTTSSSTDSPRPDNPNRDDDSVKNPGCNPDLYSHSDNGPKSQDQPNTGCGTAQPQPQPQTPTPVTAVQEATVAPEPVDLLPCDGVISTDGKGMQADVSITRMKDADATAVKYCDPFPYELKTIPGGLKFGKPTGYEWSQFILDVTWHRTFEQLDDPTTVDFEGFKEPYPVVIGDCPESLYDPETGDFIGLSVTSDTTGAELALMGIVDQDGYPSADNPVDNELTQFACVMSTKTVFQPWAEGGPHWDVFQKIWLLGDVVFRG